MIILYEQLYFKVSWLEQFSFILTGTSRSSYVVYSSLSCSFNLTPTPSPLDIYAQQAFIHAKNAYY